MVRYFYAFTPLVIVGTVVLLTLPWLGLVALLTFALVVFAAVGALAWAIVAVPYFLIRSVGRRWHERSVAHQPRDVFSFAQPDPAWLEAAQQHGAVFSLAQPDPAWLVVVERARGTR